MYGWARAKAPSGRAPEVSPWSPTPPPPHRRRRNTRARHRSDLSQICLSAASVVRAVCAQRSSEPSAQWRRRRARFHGARATAWLGPAGASRDRQQVLVVVRAGRKGLCVRSLPAHNSWTGVCSRLRSFLQEFAKACLDEAEGAEVEPREEAEPTSQLPLSLSPQPQEAGRGGSMAPAELEPEMPWRTGQAERTASLLLFAACLV